MRLEQIFKGRTDNTFTQLIRYTFVGGIAFVVDFILLYIFTEYAHFYYLFSASISFVAGSITNYLLSKAWVFQDGIIKSKGLEFLVFCIIGLVGLVLNSLFLWLLTNFCMIHYMISKIITTGVVFFWNFSGRKYLLFKTK